MAAVKLCPACGGGEPVSALLCSQCGASLLSVSPSEPAESGITPPPLPESGPPPLPASALACPDCGYANPAERTRCDRCFSPLTAPQRTMIEPVPVGYVLSWPWGEMPLTSRLGIGRDAAFSPLADRLAEYGNVSRRHAELWVSGGEVLLRDLRSTNGSFVDDRPVPPEQDTPLADGAEIHFGAALRVRVRRR